jgi:hypothetical protein
MRRPHENVATVLVDPRALEELELLLMTLDLRVWPVCTAPICVDGYVRFHRRLGGVSQIPVPEDMTS